MIARYQNILESSHEVVFFIKHYLYPLYLQPILGTVGTIRISHKIFFDV